MEETIKNIVSGFINVPADQIGPSTPIDRPAFKSSILFHRMYARLAEAGVVIDNVGNMRVVNDLLTHTRSSATSAQSFGPAVPSAGPAVPSAGTALSASGHIATRSAVAAPAAMSSAGISSAAGSGIGIDIEEIANLPKVADFRKDSFYTTNFTAAETSYCILQTDPYASFAGLFAAKEAMVKADNNFKGKFFNTIGIAHTGEGKPYYPGFELSIAHAGGVAIAVAVRENRFPLQLAPPPAAAPVRTSWLTVTAILLSLAALILAVIRRA